jgi:hypothetical protein
MRRRKHVILGDNRKGSKRKRIFFFKGKKNSNARLVEKKTSHEFNLS